MADKDEFKFDDDDTFPETDLSSAFSEGEQTAPDEPEYPMTVKKAGGSRIRILLLLLLLVIAGAGAGYYFLMMEEPAPPPPPVKKVVAAPKPAAPAPVPSQSPPATTTVPTPTAPAPAKPEAKPATVSAPAPAAAKPVAAAAPAPVKTEVKPAPELAKAETKPALIATSGPWLIEAGTFVSAGELKSVKQKIRKLGYEPQVSTMQKTVRLTRLRIGSYPEADAKEALAYARGIAPDAFTLRTGGTTTVYAGTFANQANLRRMAERFTSEGVNVAEEPVEVKRTISLVRFGGFPGQAAANEMATKARRAGIAAEVINK